MLPELRAKILAKYPAVDFDDRTEWCIEFELGGYLGDEEAVRDAVAKEMDTRQAAVQEAVARQTTAAQVEVRDLAARQVAALETAKQQKAAREAAKREKAAKEEAALPDDIRQYFATRQAKATGPAPPESA